jgi:hypothetical protein
MKSRWPVVQSSILLLVLSSIIAHAAWEESAVAHTNRMAVLQQDLFMRTAPGTNFVGKGWLVLTPERKTITSDLLPPNAKTAFMDLGCRILPSVEFRDATPLDAIQMVLQVSEGCAIPKSIGLIAPPREAPALPAWLKNATLPDIRLRCQLSRVSLLEFALRVGEVLDRDLALSEDGKIIYLTKNAPSPFDKTVYILRLQ